MALRIPVVASLALLSVSFSVQSQTPAPAGDAKHGHDLAYTCQGCHSIPNYKNVYPTYSVPKLSGQRPEYLVAALKAYKSGERSHGTMHSQASSMSEQDMAISPCSSRATRC
jgi:cytochrome c553